MEKITEQEIEEYLVHQVTQLGCYCIKQNPSFLAGVPDELILGMDGSHCFVELKNAEGKVSKAQLETQARLKRMHHRVFTLWSKEDVDNFIRREILYYEA